MNCQLARFTFLIRRSQSKAAPARQTMQQQNKTNYDQALKWADQAVTINNSFTTLSVKSNVLRGMGQNRGSRQDHE